MVVSVTDRFRPVSVIAMGFTFFYNFVPMKINNVSVVALSVTLFFGMCAPIAASAVFRPVEQRVDSVLCLMTLDEKIGQLNQLNSTDPEKIAGIVREGRVGSILNSVSPDEVNTLQRVAVEESRLGIPLLIGRDVIHGFHTILPIPLGQAATWNPALIEAGARNAAVEASACGVRWTFSPMVDISRDPRWGRVAESAGEDPVLTERVGLAMIRGYQTDDLTDPTALAACAKHFAGYGFAEAGKDYSTTWIPEPLMRDVVLPPFEAAARAGVASFMTSFNDINGIPATGNRWLLHDVLRDEWGYDGMVVSDWDAVNELIAHGVAADKREAALLAASAGVDMDMEGHCYSTQLAGLIRDGLVSEELLDSLVRNVLRLKFRLGLFDNPYTDTSRPSLSYSSTHLALAERLATESVVLLKNNDVLPFGNSVKRIAVTGPMADAPHDQCGTWSLDCQKEHTVTPLKAIRDIYGSENIVYASGLAHTRDKSIDGIAEAVKVAEDADVVLCFVGEEAVLSGEGHSMADLDLKGAQSRLVEALAATGKPLVLVVIAGRPLTISAQVDLADAVLYSFHPGTMGGPALAKLILGKANPSGKLPVTMARKTGQYPMYYYAKNTGRPPSWTVDLDSIPLEAIQSSTGCSSYYLDCGFKPLYPFGYGLSYTSFEISAPELSSDVLRPGEDLTVSCTVKNTGEVEGSEIVQLYVRDPVASIAQPVKLMKDFRKITLAPGESQRVVFSLSPSQLSFSGIDGKRVVESGKFIVWVFSSSDLESAPNPVSFMLETE